MDLGAYLNEAAGKPWAWGEHDCSAWPARWAGIPLPDYEDAAGAFELVAELGLVALWERVGAERIEPVTDPEAGDIAVIRALNANREPVEVGAIFTGERWAFVPMSGGVAVTKGPEVVKVWRPRCLKR